MQFTLAFLLQLFHTFFQTLVGKVVVVELKNDLALRGTIHSVDQYMNFKLDGAEVVDKDRFPQLVRPAALFAGGACVTMLSVCASSLSRTCLYAAL